MKYEGRGNQIDQNQEILFNQEKETCTFGGGDIPQYFLSSLRGYKGDVLMTYIDQLKYEEFATDK